MEPDTHLTLHKLQRDERLEKLLKDAANRTMTLGERLAQRKSYIRGEMGMQHSDMTDEKFEQLYLETDIGKLHRVAEFYADKKNWVNRTINRGILIVDMPESSEAYIDLGERARLTLEGP